MSQEKEYNLDDLDRWFEELETELEANKDENEIDENNEESNSDKSLSDELEKLNELRESGVLTQEEFEKAKNKLLNS